ncbi:unnamed protein product [Mesocestoides corti]|uniref:Nucleolar protein 10 n=1 Tax=Mesocestoides corti TaxID=53468 RepID=A0A0R3U7I1_MESCO|nr:unnamed protein product [Mesocestoides corti]
MCFSHDVNLFCHVPFVNTFGASCLFLMFYFEILKMPTQSAHPARYSPDDKYSEQRVTLKMRFNLLPTQQPPVIY